MRCLYFRNNEGSLGKPGILRVSENGDSVDSDVVISSWRVMRM